MAPLLRRMNRPRLKAGVTVEFEGTAVRWPPQNPFALPFRMVPVPWLALPLIQRT